jgi:ATP-dependent DNA helicase RecG
MSPHDPLTKHFRLTTPQHGALKKMRLLTVRDLLYHFPSRYERAGASGTASSLVPGTKITLIGILSKLEAKKLWKSRRTATEGWFNDASGRVKVMWFNQPYMAKMAPQGAPIKLTGTVGGSREKPYITNPEVVAIAAGEITGEGLFQPDTSNLTPDTAIFPVYPESRGITSLWFYHARSDSPRYS